MDEKRLSYHWAERALDYFLAARGEISEDDHPLFVNVVALMIGLADPRTTPEWRLVLEADSLDDRLTLLEEWAEKVGSHQGYIDRVRRVQTRAFDRLIRRLRRLPRKQ